MKRKIKTGQIWYDNEIDELVLAVSSTLVCWKDFFPDESRKDLIICLSIKAYNCNNWHYIGEL